MSRTDRDRSYSRSRSRSPDRRRRGGVRRERSSSRERRGRRHSPNTKKPRGSRDALFGGPLCTYKQFLMTTDRQHSTQAELDYETYTQAYRDHQARLFFNAHKEEPWIVERYHPLEVDKRFSDRLKATALRAQQFVFNDAFDYGPLRERSIMLTQVPRNMGLPQVAGLLGAEVSELWISQPSPLHDYLRVAYIECKDVEQKRLVLEKLNEANLEGGGKLVVAPVDESPATVVLHPVVLGRLERDIALAMQLAIQLDSETSVRVEVNVTAQLAKTDGTPEQRLLCLVRYLQRVHLYAYWGWKQYGSVSELAIQCPNYVMPDITTPAPLDDPTGSQLIDKLEYCVRERIDRPVNRDEESGRTEVEKQLEQLMASQCKPDSEGRYRCMTCSKLFMTLDFVRKHIHNKHMDLIDASRLRALEEQCFRNYMMDPNRIATLKLVPDPIITALADPDDPRNRSPSESPPRERERERGDGRHSDRSDRSERDRGERGRGDRDRGGRSSGRGGPRRDRNRGPPPPIPDGMQHDPREIRQYVDLDSLRVPAVEEEIDYRLL